MARYAAMWSGGKDSALALWRARRSGHEVAALLNFVDATTRRVRFHATPAALIAAQANALRLALRQYRATWADFPGVFQGALEALKAEGFSGVVLGDIHLADVRAWYEERVTTAALEHVEPLWGEDSGALLREFVTSGHRAVVTCCERGKLDQSWLGRVIDETFLRDIAASDVDPCGENGEYHSFAFAGPLFAEPVPWLLGPRRDEGNFAQVELIDPRALMAEVVRETIEAHPDLVEGVRGARAKAWGALAAQGVLAFRRVAGRAPDEGERRAIWDGLWGAAHE